MCTIHRVVVLFVTGDASPVFTTVMLYNRVFLLFVKGCDIATFTQIILGGKGSNFFCY